MGDWLFLLDVAIALAIPLYFYAMHRRGRHPSVFWRLFWLGFGIGLTWELAFHFTGPEYSDDPSYRHFSEFPLPAILQPIMHALWDGGLFMLGTLLVFRLCAPPQLSRFRWSELGVMLAWGQAQELAVELIAAGGGLWSFTPRPWNPVLFAFGDGVITLVPQLIWLLAAVVFYVIALRVYGAEGSSPRSPAGTIDA